MVATYLPPQPPRLAALRWLTMFSSDSGDQIRRLLLNALIASSATIAMSSLSGLLVDMLAIRLTDNPFFIACAVLEALCGVSRYAAVRQARWTAQAGAHAPLDMLLIVSITWCTLQGIVAFAVMRSANPTLQILVATLVMGNIAPICARNYAAPRLAVLLIALCDLPYIVGACLSGRPWLCVLAPLTPLFFYSAYQTVLNNRKMALEALSGKLESEARARLDPLTGIGNRLAFTEAIQAAVTAGERFTLLCLDLDGFKAVNDTHGHPAGDALLSEVAHRLVANSRTEDTVLRVGGDEFILLVHGMPPLAISALADRLIDRITQKAYRFDGFPPIFIGVSVGYSCFPEDGRTAEDPHSKADIALYASKAAGKGIQKRFEPRLVAQSGA